MEKNLPALPNLDADEALKKAIHDRAYQAMTEAFIRIRYFSLRPLNKDGREYIFRLSDAAHNIPAALYGDTYHKPDLEKMVRNLENLQIENWSALEARFIDRMAKQPHISRRWFGRKSEAHSDSYKDTFEKVLLLVACLGCVFAGFLGAASFSSDHVFMGRISIIGVAACSLACIFGYPD